MNSTDLATLYHGSAMIEIKSHNWDKAVNILKHGIEVSVKKSEIDPNVKFLFHSLGMLELDRLNPVEAERIFEAGINIFPSNSHFLLGMALAYMKLGKNDLARQEFKLSVDADVYHAHAWQCWAIFEKQCGNMELASILFKKGLKKNPTHGPLWHAYAMMEISQGLFKLLYDFSLFLIVLQNILQEMLNQPEPYSLNVSSDVHCMLKPIKPGPV
jgi:tetratricopeptide (TPR) repeat protein